MQKLIELKPVEKLFNIARFYVCKRVIFTTSKKERLTF